MDTPRAARATRRRNGGHPRCIVAEKTEQEGDMAKKDTKRADVENFEDRKEYMHDESLGAAHEGSEFPSTDDVLSDRGEGEAGMNGEVPPKDGVASEAETPAEELHGSLHGRWSATNDGQGEA
jgi:hypothetical protein